MAAIADPSHLLKAMRNAAHNNILLIAEKYVQMYGLVCCEVKWEHIVRVFEFDNKHKLKIAPHLKRRYVYFGHFGKMKVAPAKAVLGKATGQAIRFLVQHYPQEFGKECLSTALFAELVGGWHDIVNNHHRYMAFHKGKDEKNAESLAKMDHFEEFYVSIKLHKKQDDHTFKPSQIGVALTNSSTKWIKNKVLSTEGADYNLTGKNSNDPIEGFHGDERSIQKNPTAKQFKDNAKIISVSHYMGHAKGTNCGSDDSIEFMSSLRELKQIHKEEEEEAKCELNIDMAFLETNEITDFAETTALAFLGGYMLKHVILGKTRRKGNINIKKNFKVCQLCAKAFIADPETDDQVENTLIRMKEFKEGALCRPTRLGNKAFLFAEQLIRSANLEYSKQTGLCDLLTKKIVDGIKENYPDAPTCHLRPIFRRFTNARLNFDGDYIESHLTVKNKKEIKGKANASKTSKGVTLE